MKQEHFIRLMEEVKRLDDQPAAYLALDISRLRPGHCADKVLRFNKPKQAHIVDIVPLYPKREWVGLTDKEILADDVLRYYFGLNGGAGPVSKSGRKIVDALEAKLKEKNT
jgi:hypothetical protein